MDKRGTQEAMLCVTRQIYECIDNSTPCIGVFIDLAKAFDTVSHKKLNEKLYKIGIWGNTLALIKSYLENRQQYVKIHNILSDSLQVEWGIPQGTVL